MARITAGVTTSHVPGHRRGARPRQDRRALLEAGVRRLRVDQGVDRPRKPDVVILVYNDHASALLAWRSIPTFAIGCADEFTPADEGWGPRPVPVVRATPTWPGTSPSR